MSKFNVHYIQISSTHYSSNVAIKVRQKYGWYGYGIYMAVVQLLATSPNKRIKLVDIPYIIYQLRLDSDKEKATELIEFAFPVIGDEIYCEEVDEAVSSLIKKVANLNPSAAGKASAEAKKTKKLLDKINSQDTPDSQDSLDIKDL